MMKRAAALLNNDVLLFIYCIGCFFQQQSFAAPTICTADED